MCRAITQHCTRKSARSTVPPSTPPTAAKTDNNWDLTALARFTPTHTRTIEFGYAQKTRSPNLLRTLYLVDRRHGHAHDQLAGDGNGYVGNLDLKPEVATRFSATVDWHDAGQQNWGLKVTPYYTYVRTTSTQSSWMSRPRTSTALQTDQFTVLKFVNQDRRTSTASMFPVTCRWPKTTVTAVSRRPAMLNYARGEPAIRTMTLQHHAAQRQAGASCRSWGSWTTQPKSSWWQPKDDVSEMRNEMETAGYGLVNLRGSYSWKQARLDVGVENVFDRLYYHPLGGAYIGQGTTMTSAATDGCRNGAPPFPAWAVRSTLR